MAEFRLERFKYNWKGDWTSGASYKRDDIVRVNGKSYVCIITHVSSNTFGADLLATLPGSNPPQPQPKWTVMTNGKSFIGDYTPGTDYNIGDIVLYDGVLWVATVPHTASGLANESEFWEIFASNISFVGDWNTNTVYGPGAIVKYGGINYKCLNAHTSGTILEDNSNDWVEFFNGIDYKRDWVTQTSYKKNDIVKYGGTLFRCIETHTSSGPILDDSKFQIELPGTQLAGDWDASTAYNVGDVVRHNGFVYYAAKNNLSSSPYQTVPTEDWIILSKNYSFIGEWSINAAYKTGDVVLRGGNLYQALIDFQEGDGSSADYLDDSVWELLIPGKSFKGTWTDGNLYSVGDLVYYRGTAYTCNTEHEASIQNFPGDNGNIYDFWDILIPAGEEGGLQIKGDLLTYGLSRQISYLDSTVFDDSTLGSTRLGIGEEKQLLSVNPDLDVYWRNITEDAETIFVSTNGIDKSSRGTFQEPFKTIRYAAEYVEDNFPAGTPVIIRVSTGKFEEIGPIILPAGCAIKGDELRSTTVLANSPITSYQNDYQYVEEYIDYLESILLDVITGVKIPDRDGNTTLQIGADPEPVIDPETGNIVLNPETGEPEQAPRTLLFTNIDGANYIVNLFSDFENYILFRTSSSGTDPVLLGSNTQNTDSNIRNAGENLLLNKEFLSAEIVEFLKDLHPTVIFDEIKVKNDVESLIRGLARDCEFSGNYGTLTAARRYSNAVTGSQNDNLFYMRDSTGLRDLTTGGLEGVLNPPGVFDLYQKPTGGACVSLDPGWGPDDNRTWIINRSPYIQGVTNTGISCVGMKVDGALHNGGNSSMVANDFTQVLSDGVGAWVSNNGRVELVSVFTYYCQIGYFAEDGGVIRATNGNNSYGKYGSIADGEDASEVPQNVQVFNRNNQAQVKEAFAGGTNDEILLFEYTTSGEEYFEADATITGAGSNADVEFLDFRDGGLFEARLTSPDGSSAEGGANYLVRQGNAQETSDASSSIILSGTDQTQFLSEIQGMRIIITAGLGVGQYGYISGYDGNTKTVTVRKDSNDQLGWDHIISGTPLVSTFDLTTRYRIEPRVTASVNGFTTSSYPLVTNRTYVDASYGDTTATYNSVSANSKQIWLSDDNDRIIVNEIVSDISITFTASLVLSPSVPFVIEGRTSGATAEVLAITNNTGTVIEATVQSGATSFTQDEEINIINVAGSGDTFDDVPLAAEFNIEKEGRSYNVSIANGGAGYKAGDTIVIAGTALGGTTPENDCRIVVETVSADSSNSILSISSTGTGAKGRFVSLTDSEFARFSDDGINWTEVSLPFSTTNNYKKLISGNNRFIAVAANEGRVASTLNGISWTTVNLPLTNLWQDGVYGNGKFIIVGSDTDLVLVSSDGESWTTSSIPNDTVGDSTIAQWSYTAYGAGRYVVISTNDRATATSTDANTWSRNDQALPNFSGNITSITYGKNKFVVATDAGETAYSFDGVTWYTGDTLPGASDWGILKYAQGIFFAISAPTAPATNTNVAATSEDGFTWTQRTLETSQPWSTMTNGRIDGESKWVFLASGATTNAVLHASIGSRALLRADVTIGSFDSIKIWDPGSGYTSSALPVLTITDPNNTLDVAYESRIGNGVLAQPSFVNRGNGYRSSTSTITINGNGFADIIPNSNSLTVSGITNVPGPGVQIRIDGISDPTSADPDELFPFSGVEVFDLGDDGTGNGTRLVRFTVSPRLETYMNIEHTRNISLREKYSQCRISGHDFLDIGTGNFEETNYPEIYSGGNFFTAAPENEVFETNGGRVFYVSTDQDGNFRTGELFSVQQATGIVTISAEFFDLDGLSELALGGVRLGGSGTVVNEFSTDPTFAADSNNVVPTQRAIASFLSERLSVGGENLETNRLQAGRVVLGGEDNEISKVANNLLIPVNATFDGTYTATDANGNTVTQQTNVSGTIISQMMYFKEFDENMQ